MAAKSNTAGVAASMAIDHAQQTAVN